MRDMNKATTMGQELFRTKKELIKDMLKYIGLPILIATAWTVFLLLQG